MKSFAKRLIPLIAEQELSYNLIEKCDGLPSLHVETISSCFQIIVMMMHTLCPLFLFGMVQSDSAGLNVSPDVEHNVLPSYG